jgi:hypothetical protein
MFDQNCGSAKQVECKPAIQAWTYHQLAEHLDPENKTADPCLL